MLKFVFYFNQFGDIMPGYELFGDEERNEVNDVLETGVLFRYGFDNVRNNHWKARTFEQNFAKYLNSKHCLLVSSGTTALSTSMAACGIGFGDEVIVPPFTFVATIEGILSAGAIPIFVDIDETLCLNPSAIAEKITDKTKAVLVVHMCGSMAKIDDIKSLCESKNILLLEDACQATGATFNGKHVGTFGNVGCFSFDSVKTITCGEGGGIVTNDSQIYKFADYFADHGHDHIGIDRGADKHPIIGMNFRISELNAAVGVAQLRKLDRILEIQRRNHSVLKSVISSYDFIKFREIPDESGDSATFLSFFMPTEDLARKLAKDFAADGIDGSFYWYDNNWHYLKNWEHIKDLSANAKLSQKDYPNLPDYNNLDLSKSDDIISRTISMAIKIAWTDEDLQNRCNKIKNILDTYK